MNGTVTLSIKTFDHLRKCQNLVKRLADDNVGRRLQIAKQDTRSELAAEAEVLTSNGNAL